jgi:type I restriction enzyme M protein
MLDAATKRRIDDARNILVGKIPDPKSQVEQITIALIYKFMDDMDAEAEEFGGKRTFFASDFVRYGWAKLMHSGLGGHEMLNLYAEAIAKMPENPGIPPLFREIFKNAYLPYRDPQTLREFLKIIDKFTYDHSEDLGDAFEYLLSVLGSQGDAGQFRTPRHIIDFIVAIVNPKKDESILDPACGTAGFLIAAYKHILKSNTDAQGSSALTPDDKKRLIANTRGYDISPDMVRLSLVNLYLHGFNDPHIYEYDTLTSQDRWNEYANVILANPPFMSPKGGIKPHNRFSVQSKRSEVLFVDYMAEHLSSTGRAGIIVPEGIIFQSQTAYKQLRKMLVREYLVAVISLPAGVFQPYSGVKTSVLILDKALAKQRGTLAFFKVENDGLSLGAQRRPIEKNDLPGVEAEALDYLQRLRSGENVLGLNLRHGLVVEKEKIAKGGEYGLSGERYKESDLRKHSFPLVALGDSILFCIESGGTPKSDNESFWNGGIPWVTLADIPSSNRITYINSTQRTISQEGLQNSSAKVLPKNSILVSTRATIGRIAINIIPTATNQGFKNIVIKNSDKAEYQYIALIIKKIVPAMESIATGGTFKEISKSAFSELKIPLPPLEIQKEIVAEIEGYQKIIDGARAVVDNYRPKIDIRPEWPIVELGELCVDFQNGANFARDQVGRGTRFVNIKDLFSDGYVDFSNLARVELSETEIERKRLKCDDLLFVRSSVKEEGVGFPSLVGMSNEPIVFCGFIIRCSPKSDVVHPQYLLHLLRTQEYRAKIIGLSNRANITNISQESLKTLKLPLPPLEIQRTIVVEIEAEQALVSANRELIARFEKKIEAVLARVWG